VLLTIHHEACSTGLAGGPRVVGRAEPVTGPLSGLTRLPDYRPVYTRLRPRVPQSIIVISH